jgi:hypothetical protein
MKSESTGLPVAGEIDGTYGMALRLSVDAEVKLMKKGSRKVEYGIELSKGEKYAGDALQVRLRKASVDRNPIRPLQSGVNHSFHHKHIEYSLKFVL